MALSGTVPISGSNPERVSYIYNKLLPKIAMFEAIANPVIQHHVYCIALLSDYYYSQSQANPETPPASLARVKRLIDILMNPDILSGQDSIPVSELLAREITSPELIADSNFRGILKFLKSPIDCRMIAPPQSCSLTVPSGSVSLLGSCMTRLSKSLSTHSSLFNKNIAELYETGTLIPRDDVLAARYRLMIKQEKEEKSSSFSFCEASVFAFFSSFEDAEHKKCAAIASHVDRGETKLELEKKELDKRGESKQIAKVSLTPVRSDIDLRCFSVDRKESTLWNRRTGCHIDKFYSNAFNRCDPSLGSGAYPDIFRDICNAKETIVLAGWTLMLSKKLIPGGRTLIDHLYSAANRGVKVVVLIWNNQMGNYKVTQAEDMKWIESPCFTPDLILSTDLRKKTRNSVRLTTKTAETVMAIAETIQDTKLREIVKKIARNSR